MVIEQLKSKSNISKGAATDDLQSIVTSRTRAKLYPSFMDSNAKQNVDQTLLQRWLKKMQYTRPFQLKLELDGATYRLQSYSDSQLLIRIWSLWNSYSGTQKLHKWHYRIPALLTRILTFISNELKRYALSELLLHLGTLQRFFGIVEF